MNPFFIYDDGTVNTERQQALQREAERWVGTPFSAYSMVCGAGVDCVHLAAALYIAAGALKNFCPPVYSLDGGLHNEESTVLKWLDAHPSFKRINIGPLDDGVPSNQIIAPGDLLCFKFGRSEHHVGVLTRGNHFLHAPIRKKVVYGTLKDPVYQRTLSAVYRPILPITT